MGLSGLAAGTQKMRRHSKSLTTVACAGGLSLCLIVSGCNSSAGSSPSAAGSAGGSASSPVAAGSLSSSCDSAAYRYYGRAPLTTGQPVLAGIQRPGPVIIPDPDVNIIDEARPQDENPDEQETWATKENAFAQSVADNQSQNQVDLQTVSNEVSADEVASLLADDLNALDAGDDEYDADLCKSIGDLKERFGNALDYYSNLTQVVNYLNGLSVIYNSSAPGDLATAISDAQNKFQQALGICVDDLETINWIVEQIHRIFCEEGE
jgi:hypothetical protein